MASCCQGSHAPGIAQWGVPQVSELNASSTSLATGWPRGATFVTWSFESPPIRSFFFLSLGRMGFPLLGAEPLKGSPLVPCITDSQKLQKSEALRHLSVECHTGVTDLLEWGLVGPDGAMGRVRV